MNDSFIKTRTKNSKINTPPVVNVPLQICFGILTMVTNTSHFTSRSLVTLAGTLDARSARTPGRDWSHSATGDARRLPNQGHAKPCSHFPLWKVFVSVIRAPYGQVWEKASKN
ncbi:hypothetical protein O3G_MSEX000792 [Manduca sexta]|nr:hypothetical protein O3G_MSEX000792 [Manduca sexta]